MAVMTDSGPRPLTPATAMDGIGSQMPKGMCLNDETVPPALARSKDVAQGPARADLNRPSDIWMAGFRSGSAKRSMRKGYRSHVVGHS